MSTFAELSAKAAGVGVAYLLEGSTDLFVTTHYAFSTHDGLFGAATAYDQRIAEIGDLQRGFGVDGTLAASSVQVRLANTDAGCDFLITSPTILFKVRWRLKIVLFDTATPSDFAVKTLGIFVNLDNPSRDKDSVVLNLADDSFGQAAELAIPPTGSEAFAAALDSSSTEPPVPIAMGGGTIPVIYRPFDGDDTTVYGVLCATTDTADVGTDEVEAIWLSGDPLNGAATVPDSGVGLPSTVTLANTTGGGTTAYPIWTVAKTASLVKDGRTWRVLYLNIFVANLRDYLTARGYLAQETITVITAVIGGIPVYADVLVTMSQSTFNTTILPRLKIQATGPRFSSRTYTTAGTAGTIHAPDIVYDLLRYYSRGLTSSEVNQASFTAAASAAPLYFLKASYYFSSFNQDVMLVSNGSALGRRTAPGVASVIQGVLRRAVSELCQGGFFDVVTDWSGQFVAHVLANNFALQTATPTVVDETLLQNPSDKVPSAGERWAPYNRVIFRSNGKTVDNATAITSWGVVLARSVNDSTTTGAFDSSLLGADFGVGTFGGLGVLESVVRPIFSFDYPLDALTWELGDFIAVTWSRGASGLGVWSSTVFRIESLVLHPARCTVSVKAVYIDDLTDQLPYLLDDETMIVRSKGVLTGAAAPVASDVFCDFGGTINLTTMGVVAGDILILRDSAESAAAFLGNLACLIVDVPTTTRVEVLAAFNASVPASILNADWSIVRGATTYHTAVSDPTNYPSGGTMYGKQSESGTFSDASTANLLQGG